MGAKGHLPLLLSNMIQEWPARNWSPGYLANVLKGKKFDCRVGCKAHLHCSYDVLWEADCHHVSIEMADFVDWLMTPRKDNPLYRFNASHYWCYIDYKYLKDIADDLPHLLKAVKWDVFGLSGQDGTDSTLWVGSEGAYTPCHFDTYGFNLVAQIYGRKRWILFPPSAANGLYPTRLPYEESSVFSEVNIRNPDLLNYPAFKSLNPYVITLRPGDVLYVPRHWWHFVENIDTSISINTWVDLPEDDESRLQEAISRVIFSKWSSSVDFTNFKHWLNPTEKIMSHDINMHYLERMLERVGNKVEENVLAGKDANSERKKNFTEFLKSLEGIIYGHISGLSDVSQQSCTQAKTILSFSSKKGSEFCKVDRIVEKKGVKNELEKGGGCFDEQITSEDFVSPTKSPKIDFEYHTSQTQQPACGACVFELLPCSFEDYTKTLAAVETCCNVCLCNDQISANNKSKESRKNNLSEELFLNSLLQKETVSAIASALLKSVPFSRGSS